MMPCLILEKCVYISPLCCLCAYILSAINPQVLLRSADTLMHLKLSAVNFKKEVLLFIISLLENSSNLEELYIEVTKKTYASQFARSSNFIF